MKVSIKHLSITFMGNEETKVTAAPTEFYSPYERELRAKLETAESERNYLTAALLQAHKDRFADKLKPDDAGNIIADRLGDALATMTKQRDDLREQRDTLVTKHKQQAEELALIRHWVADYDKGQWPDHNAAGIDTTSKEVLHIFRDLWADLESRPLPAKLDKGEYWVTAKNINEQVTQYGDCLFVAFNEDGDLTLGAYHSKDEALKVAAACASAKPTLLDWGQAGTATRVAMAEPVGVGQPEQETPDTQPADLQSWLPGPTPANQMPTAKICPGFNCSNYLGIGQTYCMAEDCAASNNARFPQQPTLPSADFVEDTLQAENEARKALADEYPTETKDVSRPPCNHAKCEEPRAPQSSFCHSHRKPALR